MPAIPVIPHLFAYILKKALTVPKINVRLRAHLLFLTAPIQFILRHWVKGHLTNTHKD